MIELFDNVDRLVDIMNGAAYKNGKSKDVELINTPRHRHIKELFDVLKIFEEWKAESEKRAKERAQERKREKAQEKAKAKAKAKGASKKKVKGDGKGKKKEVKKEDKPTFITSYTYEDLVWMVFGTAAVCGCHTVLEPRWFQSYAPGLERLRLRCL